jgi:hypothetical protein
MAEIIGLPSGVTLKDIKSPEIEGLPSGVTLKDIGKSTTEDVLRGAGSGLATGVAGLPGFLGDISSLGNVGLNKLNDLIGGALGYTPEQIEKTKAHGSPIFPTTERVKQITGFDKSDYEPQTTAGKYAKTISEFIPGAATGGAGTFKGILGNVAKFGVAPGAASELAGQSLEGTPYEGAGRVITGLATPLVTHGLMSPGRGFKGAPETEAAYAEHVANVKKEGIPVSPGEQQNSRQLRYAESMLDPEGYIKNREAVTAAATRKVSNGMHETSTIKHGKDGTLDTMLREIGDRYDALNARNNFHLDAPLAQGITDIKNTYNSHPGIYGKDTVAAVNGWIDRIGEALRKGPNPHQLTGEEYHTILKDLRAKRMNATSPREEEALKAIEDQMTGAMERSVRPEDRGIYKRTDADYKNALALGHAISRAGAETHLTPAGVEAGAKHVYGTKEFERGASPFNWATSAKEVLRMMPDSGTAHRAVFPVVNAALGSFGGAIAGSMFGHAHGLKEPIEALLALEHLGAPVGAFALPPIERAGYKALSPYLRNRWTASQDAPVRSLPGLLTADTAARQNDEERKKPRLSISVP